MAKKSAKAKTSNESKKSSKYFLEKKSAWELLKKDTKKIMDFCEPYKTFMETSKSERGCVKNVIAQLKKSGFKNIQDLKKLNTGDKFYKVTKEKSVLAAIVGKDKESFTLVGSHMDSPRLDLKPNPVNEDSGLVYLQSHYYGGIKKYHWVNTPLMLTGVIFTQDGNRVELTIGDKETDPKFIISDLLPHLARNQMEKTGSKVVEGEELKIFVGSIPVDDKDVKEKVKFTLLEKLHKEYGIIEEDFAVAELQALPATKPTDIGFDRGLIGAYGHDDKVCVYTTLRALVEIKTPKQTAIGMFVDKEEIGSVGNTGAASLILENFISDYKELTSVKKSVSQIFESSMALSADVTAGMNPIYKDVNEPMNAAYLGNGISIQKYTGSGGKYSANDSHAEFASHIRSIFKKENVPYQFGEMGRIDVGGGGTIALFLSRYGLDIIDAGPAVLGMHSPCELVSKVDIYASYLAYKAFYEQ